jgi:hypothetical protein
MMKQLKDANAVVEQIKKGNYIYYRDPEYPSNFRKVDPKVAINGMNPFTHPDVVFYRLISEEEAIENSYEEFEKEANKEQAYTNKYPHSTDFFLKGWESCKKYHDWRFNNI